MRILLENISTVGELKRALSEIPDDTFINPFGSPNCKLAYDKANKIAYLDEDIDDECWNINDECMTFEEYKDSIKDGYMNL